MKLRYSKEFLKYALTAPGYKSEYHVVLRVKSNKKIIACCMGTPVKFEIDGKTVPMAQLNFLAVHEKLRSKRLTPVIMKEMIRRFNCNDIWHGIATATPFITKPISKCCYYYKILNNEKFNPDGGGNTKQNPKDVEITLPLRPVKKSDIPDIHKLLMIYFKEKLTVYPHWTEKDTEHYLLPRENVISSYVIETDGKITDFISFYTVMSYLIETN
eukprot:UN25428